MTNRPPTTDGLPAEPLLDAVGGTMVLPRELVPVCLLLHHGVPSIDERLAADVAILHEAGIVRTGSLTRPAARLIAPLAKPEVLISVEILEPERPTVLTVWRSPVGVTLGRSVGPDVFELRQLDPSMVPFDLAACLGLRVRRERASTPRFWDAAELADRSRAPGRRWRASTMWAGSDGSIRDQAIEILDDSRSYWEITGMDGGRLFLATPRRFDDVLRLLADLDPLV